MERRTAVRNNEEVSRVYSVAITCASSASPGALLKIAATLHRRGVDIRSASLTTAADGCRCFRAVFAVSPGRAETVGRSLRNLIGVTEVVLVEDEG